MGSLQRAGGDSFEPGVAGSCQRASDKRDRRHAEVTASEVESDQAL
jgi:hypothetical protein